MALFEHEINQPARTSVDSSLSIGTKNTLANNPTAGYYVNVGDAKIDYETYGQGPPLVMLHGGVYGGIDEFEALIPKFAGKFQMICIATRGHGKSELGGAGDQALP